MSAVKYIAVDRGQLIVTTSPNHTEGTEYSIDVKLSAFSEVIEAPKSTHVSMGGNVETVLQRTTRVYSTVFIWPHTDNENIEEWLYSVAGGEPFILDPYGKVATIDNELSVVCANADFTFGRMTHGNAPWRSVSLSLRANV